jgi:ferrous iron transport protein B
MNQFVGNWPGVTVEKKEGKLKGREDVIITDLPGIYSLSPYTPEEVIARNYLTDERPDVILNIVDGTNIERNLYLTTQLAELGIPLVVAVNMIDVVNKNGDKISSEKLAGFLGSPVVEISAFKGTGIDEAEKKALEAAAAPKAPLRDVFSGDERRVLKNIEEKLTDAPKEQRYFYAVKAFERDEKIMPKLNLDPTRRAAIDEEIKKLEEKLDDSAESIIAVGRYTYIDSIIKECVKIKSKGKLSPSDKIDRVVTNRFLALPIFALVMFIVYYVSVTSVGTVVTDWANDGVFSEGWNLFGLEVPGVPIIIGNALNAANCSEWLQGLIIDGIVAGVGAVLGFVPQMLILFMFLAFLEYCGYMARIAFIMDRIFRRFGLSGKSFIPILIGTGCGVPGIMASRTIESENDRRMTVITTTFIPCSAKLPIIALIAGALFGGAAWVSPTSYFVGIAAIICSGVILKKTNLFAGEAEPFIMELPPYRWPTVGAVLRSMWERGWSFIKKAATIILLATVFIWFTSAFGWNENGFGAVEMQDSVLARTGSIIAPIFAPLGWGNWKAAVAAITGLIAKENVVGTFGILYGFAEVAEDGAEVWARLAAEFTALSAFSFLLFNLLCAPCFAAMGAIKREMNSVKWFFIAIGYECGLAYVVSLCVYQFGILADGVFGFWTFVAFVFLAVFLYMLFRPVKKAGELKVKTA